MLTKPREDHGPALWLMPGSVNEVAFDLFSGETSGRIIREETMERRGSQSIGVRQVCSWIGPDGRIWLRDVRRARVAAGPCDGGILDLNFELQAPADTRVSLGCS